LSYNNKEYLMVEGQEALPENGDSAPEEGDQSTEAKPSKPEKPSEEESPTQSEVGLLKEEVMNDLDTIVRRFRDDEIVAWDVLQEAKAAWVKAHQNPELSRAIGDIIKEQDDRFQRFFGKLGQVTPKIKGARRFIDPDDWLNDSPPGDTGDYFIEGIQTLRECLSNLDLS
jgi:hypothetical protein